MTELHLTSEQEVEAQAVFQRLKAAFEREALVLARVMARKEDRELLGRTEFTVREQVHRLGAQVLEAVLPERKKKLPGGADALCRLCRDRARCRLPGQDDRARAGSGAPGAALFPLCDVWPGVLPLGRGVGGDDDGLEPRCRRNRQWRGGP